MTCKSLLTLPAMVLALGIGSAFAAPGAGVTDIGGGDASLGTRSTAATVPASWGRPAGTGTSARTARASRALPVPGFRTGAGSTAGACATAAG